MDEETSEAEGVADGEEAAVAAAQGVRGDDDGRELDGDGDEQDEDEAQRRKATAEGDDRIGDKRGEDEERPGDRRDRHDDRGDADAGEELHGGKPTVGRPNGPRGAGCVGGG